MGDTKIEWATKVWNPVTGCEPVSEGCAYCYAARMAKRLAKNPQLKPEVRARYKGFKVAEHPERWDLPLMWKQPQRIFVNSMGDCFHPAALHLFGNVVCAAMGNPRHIFMVLTKRPEGIITWINNFRSAAIYGKEFPDNLWLGVTCENQQRADERIPVLLSIPAKHHFVSVEPMLGLVDLKKYMPCHCAKSDQPGWANGKICPDCNGYPFRSGTMLKGGVLDWIICGGETGPGARVCHAKWVFDLAAQCDQAGAPFFFKQRGSNPDGLWDVQDEAERLHREFPAELRRAK